MVMYICSSDIYKSNGYDKLYLQVCQNPGNDQTLKFTECVLFKSIHGYTFQIKLV